MPPKKNVDKESLPGKPTKEKTSRKRVKKEKVEKPKLKTPTILKMKLPSLKSLLSNAKKTKISPGKSSGDKPPVVSPAVQRKIDLANEVAQAQLGKPVLEFKPPDVVPENKPKPLRKRGRPTKLVFQNTITIVPECPAEPIQKIKPKNVVVKKPQAKRVRKKSAETGTQNKSENKTETKTSATNRRKADSTSNAEPTRRSSRQRAIKNHPIVMNTENEEVPMLPKGKMPDVNDITGCKQSPSILDDANFQTEPKDTTASEVYSRKTSIASECLSWTKDISSSSTTTCLTVGSNDFVRIDKKLPVVRLPNIDRPSTEQSGELSDSSDSSDSSSASSFSTYSRFSCKSPSLNLSTSSKITNRPENTQWKQTLEKLSLSLKKIDIEAINWIGYGNQDVDVGLKAVQEKIFKCLKLENDVLEICKNIKNHFRPDGLNSESFGKDNRNIVVNNVDRSEEDNNFTSSRSKYVMFDQNCAVDENPLEVSKVYGDNSEEDNFTSDKVTYMSFEEGYNNDDDDALSLFAESLTGIESSKYNTSANSMCADASDIEEYIPEPMKSKDSFPVSASYVPTRISNEELQANQNKAKAVCEKQNADSTSIYRVIQSRPPDIAKTNEKAIQDPGYQTAFFQFDKTVPPPPIKKKPILLSNVHNILQGVKSVVFRGVCFYNLISNCKKINCVFPHQQLSQTDVYNRLAGLTNEMFIQEYMLMRSWPTLRRQHGISYAQECVKRKLTRVLVEMSADYILKCNAKNEEDLILKINIAEQTLMYLNSVNLNTCIDLLQYELKTNVLLCDVLMQLIAETQNFSRFKAVFIKLTNFITDIGRRIRANVAVLILERVCILPYEELIATAMVKIIKNTDPKIFQNKMISKFENQLVVFDLALLQEFNVWKENASLYRGVAQDSVDVSPRISQEVDQIMFTDTEKRYTSPDTTKLDNLTKAVEETEVTPPSIFNHLFPLNHSSPMSNDSPENYRNKFRNWRGNVQNHHFGMRYPRMPMPPMKRRGSQRHVVYRAGPTPPKFPRIGPDFF